MENAEFFKKLTPYLPYELKVLIYFGWPAQQIKTMMGITFNKILTIRINHYAGTTTQAKKFIPILHPLTDLTKEIEVNGEKFIPKDRLKEKALLKGFMGVSSMLSVLNEPKGYDDLFHWMYQDLIKWHFDLFSLIKKELAIDINTLKS